MSAQNLLFFHGVADRFAKSFYAALTFVPMEADCVIKKVVGI